MYRNAVAWPTRREKIFRFVAPEHELPDAGKKYAPGRD